MRFAAEAGDDGAAQSRTNGSCFIHFLLKRLFPTITWFARSLRFSTCHGSMPSWRLIIPNSGRPSIDPELMIRMLIIGYVFAIRSE
jgi:Transposase domain (DUF772)